MPTLAVFPMLSTGLINDSLFETIASLRAQVADLQTRNAALADERNQAIVRYDALVRAAALIIWPEGNNPIEVSQIRADLAIIVKGWIEARVILDAAPAQADASALDSESSPIAYAL